MKNLFFALTLLAALQVRAHGEDKPGPHGGFISMPGAFHVELVPAGKTQLKAYLLDMHWKNPSVKDSSLEISHGMKSAKCAPEKDHFVCDFGAGVDLTRKGEIKVAAVREKAKGNSVAYSLPLRLPAAPAHHGH